MAAPAPASLAPRLTMARILGSIVAGLVIWQSVHGVTQPLAEALPRWWNLAPLALAVVALLLIWRTPPRWSMAALVLITAVLMQVFVVFGNTAFARNVATGVVAVLALYYGWIYLVLPLFAWQRGRWPVEPMALDAYVADPAWPASLQRRLHALEAQGFTPRLMHARTEGHAAATIVILAHAQRPVTAKVAHFAFGDRTYAATALGDAIRDTSSATQTRTVLTDTPPADVFPPSPERRVLLFPDASAETLLRHHAVVTPRRGDRATLSDDALRAQWNDDLQRHERFLVDAGYLSPTIENGARRYTAKGGFASVWRSLWPWSTRERARQLRDGREALRAASARGGA